MRDARGDLADNGSVLEALAAEDRQDILDRRRRACDQQSAGSSADPSARPARRRHRSARQVTSVAVAGPVATRCAGDHSGASQCPARREATARGRSRSRAPTSGAAADLEQVAEQAEARDVGQRVHVVQAAERDAGRVELRRAARPSRCTARRRVAAFSTPPCKCRRRAACRGPAHLRASHRRCA